jgi:hypothetical protein
LIHEASLISTVSKTDQQKHNQGDDSDGRSPADANGFLRLWMEIESVWRFDRPVLGIIVCGHG